MSHVLIVDDEESICWGFQRLLTDVGHSVAIASSAEEALEQAAVQQTDLVLLDVRLPGMDGLAAMEALSAATRCAPIIVMTAFGSLEIAVTALRQGAFEYLVKPFDLDGAAKTIGRALTSHGRLPAEASEHSGSGTLVGSSPAMQEVFKRIALVASTDCPVLITGESGTGKELVARAIHHHSLRHGEPFVPVHLAALSPTLVESELFGHARGAFTGADASRRGLLELAHGGTVFFDECGDIPIGAQVKLLRVLEQGELTPVGESNPRNVSFRVIAATHRQLAAAPEEVFRRDLYYRLAVFEIKLPPLSERTEDIPLLADAFLQNGHGSVSPGITGQAMEELCSRPWIGNVRELRNAIEHALVMARGDVIDIEHLPPPVVRPSAGSADPRALLREAVRSWAIDALRANGCENLHQQFLACTEPVLFEEVLERTNGNRARAADVLGLHRATLRKKLD